MSDLVTNPDDPRLGHGTDEMPVPQNAAYLVLSAEERARGFVRPVRGSYRHVGPPGPTNPLRELTADERERHAASNYVAFEQYPQPGPEFSSVVGRFWTQAQLDAVGRACGAVTHMSLQIAETYARDPHFYGATYCAHCRMHRPVGREGEFVWEGTNARVGT